MASAQSGAFSGFTCKAALASSACSLFSNVTNATGWRRKKDDRVFDRIFRVTRDRNSKCKNVPLMAIMIRRVSLAIMPVSLSTVLQCCKLYISFGFPCFRMDSLGHHRDGL